MTRLITSAVLAALATGACAAPQPQPTQCKVIRAPGPPPAAVAPVAQHHFFDASAVPIDRYEPVWPLLAQFFGESLPPRVTIVYEPAGVSHIDTQSGTIYLVLSTIQGQSELALVAHETSHLALATLTNGASTEQPFRFLDEGFATVMQKQTDGLLPAYRHTCRAFAAQRLKTGTVRIADLQAWRTYFGNPKVKVDWTAYDVGAAFVLFLEDSFGEERWMRLLVDIGKTRSLGESLSHVLGWSLDETEQHWDAYLAATEPPAP